MADHGETRAAGGNGKALAWQWQAASWLLRMKCACSALWIMRRNLPGRLLQQVPALWLHCAGYKPWPLVSPLAGGVQGAVAAGRGARGEGSGAWGGWEEGAA